jgi:type II secretory pathway predicted ATPase ExeA
MYEAFFDLNRRPFTPAPDPNRYFPAETIENARQNLLRCVQRSEGTGLVTGPSGTGKTLLCQVLAEQLRPALSVVHLCSGRLGSPGALYQAILHGLGRSYRGMDEGELHLALVDYLTCREDPPVGLVLLVDEAHTLSLRLLDEVRMLTNLVCSGESRVRVVLAGGPILEERFASPKLESFAQRLAVRCYLEPFSRSETEQYVCAQIDAAGGKAGELFTAEAAGAVYQATDGVPRLVNQLCDHVLLLAWADGDSTVDAPKVEAAWADLQQLPAPWTADESEGAAPDIIEFGGLEDDALPSEEPVPTKSESASLELLSSEEEPGTRVEQLERTLSELEDSPGPDEDARPPRPAETMEPEVALVFEEPSDPFTEQFAEEEEVVQPYDGTIKSESETIDMAMAPPTAKTIHGDSLATERSTGESPQTKEALIVVEEEDKPDADIPTPRIAGPRRDRYRHLFAKLRHD